MPPDGIYSICMAYQSKKCSLAVAPGHKCPCAATPILFRLLGSSACLWRDGDGCLGVLGKAANGGAALAYD